MRRPAGAHAAAAVRPARSAALDAWGIVALVGLALALRLPGIGAGLPEVYEEAYPFKVAWRMWGWGPGQGLDLNPHWFKYPGLTIDLQFLGQGLLYLALSLAGEVRSTLDFRVLHQLDKTPFYLMGRGITAVLGAATVVPLFLLARNAAGRVAGFLAAALVAVSPALIAKSRVIEVDVPLALLVAWTLWAAVRLGERLTLARSLAAGILVALATMAKYPGIVLVIPCLVAVAEGARGARPPAPGGGSRRASRSRTVRWPVACGVLGAGLLATCFVVSPYLFLDFRSALADLGVEREHMRLGHFGTELGPTWRSYLGAWFGPVAGPTVAGASAAALAWFLVRRRPWAAVVGSFVIAYSALVSSFAMKADRYLLPLLPAAFVFAGALVAELSGRLGPGPRRPPPPATGGRSRAQRDARGAGPGRNAIVLAACGLLVLPALAGLPAQLAGGGTDTRTLAKQWFEANVPPGSFVASEPYGPPLLSPLELQAIDRDLLPELQRRGYQPKVYAVVSVPLFQVAPERSARFYDPALYRVADAFIVTGSVRERYRREPGRFAPQIAFYDTLASSWELWREFPSTGSAGPSITVYRRPGHSREFAARRPSPGPAPVLGPGPASGGEAYFYYNVGLNYELFGFVAEALPAYLEGLRWAAADPVSATGCAERAAGLLVRVGRASDAGALLEEAAERAPRPADAARLRALRERILSGG